MGHRRPNGTTFDLQEPAMSSMPWQSARKSSSEIQRLAMGEKTAVRGDPDSVGTVNSYQGQSLFPANRDSVITETHLEWRG